MGKINYYQWLNGGCGCNGVRHISGTNDCDCDQILLEISNLHTDDEVLQDEIDDLSGDVSTKLDASAYTPVDLSDYYTKEQVDEKIASGGSGTSITVDDHLDLNSINPAQNKVITEALNGKLDESAYTPTDLSNYYNKSEVNDIITSAITDVEAEIPSLSGYATQQWVINQGYSTNSELIQYITNLQQQINSLTTAISGCCGSSGETQYRWITETGENDYWCSGTTKMSKEKQQSSTDGINWTDTGSERSGSTVLEENCTDCGYVPVYGTKLVAHYNNGNTKTVQCTGVWEDSFIDGRDYRSFETGASGLTEVEIGTCPTAIAGYGFSGCTSLSAVTIPNNVTDIGLEAFNGCESLLSLTLPSSISRIESYALTSNLTSLTCLATTPPSLGGILGINSNTIIYVPAESVESYKTAQYWSTYASRIQAIS